MADKSRTKYIILGVLSIAPASGYDITQAIKNGIDHFWSESEGQIYPNLAKCVTDRLITCRETSTYGRLKKVYTITSRGEETLKQWLEMKPKKALVRNEVLIKLFFAKSMEKDKCIHMLEEFIHQKQDDLHKYQAQLEKLNSIPAGISNKPYWIASLTYSITSIEAELQWANQTLVQLSNLI